MDRRALLLTPSRGRGGGIERYSDTLEWALKSRGVDCLRIDLRGVGPGAHAQMLAQARRELRSAEEPAHLVVAHRALLPVASVLGSIHPTSGISIICHGIDVWGPKMRARRQVENYLMRRPNVRVVAVSSFTAGVLASGCPATILPPGLSQTWFDTLVGAASSSRVERSRTQIVSAFRLADWRKKGLPQLLEAVAALRRADVTVTICGTGEPTADLLRLVHGYGFCSLRPGLTDHELARELAGADAFVLATRTKTGSHPSGEGFGLVLLEAQVAGTPVVAPAFGGSHDAFIDGVTGLAPADETARSLTKVLAELLNDPTELSQMGTRAAEWARNCFAPEKYASRVARNFL